MFAPLRHRDFRLLWAAGLVNAAGDWVLLIALPFYVYRLTGSALLTGGMFMAATLPRLFLGSVAGAVADRFDRRRLAAAADLARVMALLPLLLLQSAEWVWLVYLTGFCESVLGQLAAPAKAALLARTVPAGEIGSATALYALNHEVNRLLAPPLGALLLAALGLPGVVLADAATFLLSGLLILGVGRAAGPPPPPDPAAPPRAFARDWLAGLHLVRADRRLAAIFAMMGTAMIAEGFFVVLFVPWVTDALGGGPAELAWVMSAQAVGGIGGGLLLSRLADRLPAHRLAPAGLAGLGAVLLTFAARPSLPVVLALSALAGVAVMAAFVTLNSRLQRVTADAFRGRVQGALNALIALAMLIGMGLAGGLGDRVGAATALALGGLFYLAAALIGALTLGAEGQRGRGAEERVVEAVG